MIYENVIKASRAFLSLYIKEGDIVIDATCGNGNDTLFLANVVGETGIVYGFDVQAEAINNTMTLLEKNNIKNVEIVHDSHCAMKKYVEKYLKEISGVVFNLGYLPSGENKKITTTAVSTIDAIKTSLEILKVSGIILLAVYVGHEEGLSESIELDKYLKTISPREATVLKYKIINRKNAPYIIIIQKNSN